MTHPAGCFPSRIECLNDWWLLGPLLVFNLVIAAGYFLIPPRMVWAQSQASEGMTTRGKLVYWGFAVFIVSCGTGHLVDTMTIWFGWAYWVRLAVDASTAVFTSLTALAFYALTRVKK